MNRLVKYVVCFILGFIILLFSVVVLASFYLVTIQYSSTCLYRIMSFEVDLIQVGSALSDPD